MSSYPSAYRRVRDTGLPRRDRVLALRECVLRFAPYGFSATWHHLVVSGGPSLLAMVDELEQARQVWLASHEEFLARRRAEKAAGNRIPRRTDRWHNNTLAYCPDFEAHPVERLAVVVQRVITAHESGARRSERCFACGRTPGVNIACPDCGVSPSFSHIPVPGTARRWREVWLRSKEFS
ncbi:hypothetical protein AB5J62_11000 [Amycolatopsis sp. cg5]|uniref:hypothetical protein n=1 Tax=Amycolatopsis sp. cg5 TaxID=3238802 RepID=UPI003525C0CA